MKKIFLYSVTIFLLSSSFVIFSAAPKLVEEQNTASRIEILRPLLAIPVIEEKGGTFEILVGSDASSASNWRVTISTEYDSFQLPILNLSMPSPGNWSVNVTIPSTVRADLYDLNVVVDGISDIEPHAVSVINRFKSEFSFIHITDIHIGSVRGGSTYTEFGEVIKEINLIHPDFVIDTGDCCDKEPTLWSTQEFPADQQDKKYRERLLEFNVPVYVVNGNHDYSYVSESSIADFRRWVNPVPDYSFNYGDYHFTGLDAGKYVSSLIDSRSEGLRADQIRWLENDLARHNHSTRKFVFLHYPPDKLTNFASEYRTLLRKYNVSVSIEGHTHEDKVYDKNYVAVTEDGTVGNPEYPLFIETRSTTKGTDNGYRLYRVNGHRIESYTYDADGNGMRDDTSSIPTRQLRVSYFPSNDGTAPNVTAYITNNLREDFSSAFIVFKMPKLQAGNFFYAVENGTIEQRIAYTGYDVYYVRADIPRMCSLNVTIKQTPGFVITLTPGWKLVSVPINMSGTVEVVLASISGCYDAVKYFDGTGWKHYCPGGGLRNTLTTITEKMGFWLHITKPCRLEFSGTPPASTTLSLVGGWNLIGYPSLTPKRVGEIFKTQITRIQNYSPTASYNLRMMDPAEYMYPGQGYWVYAEKAVKVTIS